MCWQSPEAKPEAVWHRPIPVFVLHRPCREPAHPHSAHHPRRASLLEMNTPSISTKRVAPGSAATVARFNSSRSRPPPSAAVLRNASTRTGTGRTATARTSTARTTTGRPRTATARCEDAYVVAVIDNPVREVGLCAYDLNGFVVELRQFADSNTYVTLIKVLCVMAPVEILLSTSSMGGMLEQAIQNSPHLLHVKRTFIGRPFFNETYGALAVDKLSNQPCPHLTRLGSALYLSLASCGALIRYIEHVEDRIFPPSSLRVYFKPNDDTLFLDLSALEGLEVVGNARSANGLPGMHSTACLLREIDFTRTRAGKRFLRRAVLEPCSDLKTITMRQDVVEELCNAEPVYFSLDSALRRFPDLEKAMAILMGRENARLREIRDQADQKTHSSSPHESEQEQPNPGPIDSGSHLAAPPSIVLMKTVLNIKAALETIPEMLQAMENATSPLLRAVAQSLRDPALSNLREYISDVIDPDMFPNKNPERMRMNGAYAVKHGRNGYLDIHRKAMGERIEDMHILMEDTRKKHNLKKLELSLHLKRGYHFSIASKFLDVKDFPEEFNRIDEGRKVHRFSSEQLERLNVRYQESLKEIWRLSELELGDLLGRIFQTDVLRAVHRLCDSIAILDCLLSFVTYAPMSPCTTVRPKLTEDGPIELKKAFHPTAVNIPGQKTVPNDVFLDETSALLIISGRNQAGKSFFIKTVGLIAIMAHTGCWVPAESASIRVLKRVATRFVTGDDISQCQSNFSKEMQDVASIFNSVHCSSRDVERALKQEERASSLQSDSEECAPYPSTLVLIDELGRSTSTLDGFSIAYAVAEELAARPNTLTLFTTHFIGLGALAQVNPMVRNFHLISQSRTSRQESDSSGDAVCDVIHTFKVSSGVLPDTSYGTETARMAGIPEDVLKDAEEIKRLLPHRRIETPHSFFENFLVLDKEDKDMLRKANYTVAIANRLREITRSSADEQESHRLLVELQQELQERSRKKKEAKKRKHKSSGRTQSLEIAEAASQHEDTGETTQ